jgi:hypothetical protein
MVMARTSPLSTVMRVQAVARTGAAAAVVTHGRWCGDIERVCMRSKS